MRNLIRRLVLLGLAAALLFGAWVWWQIKKASALPEGIVRGNGRIESVQVDVTAKYAGRLAQMLVREGDLVKPGQIVARIDTDETEAMLAKAKAQIAEARAEVADVKAQIVKDETNAKLAEQNYTRGRALFSRKTIPREEYDQLLSTRDASNAAVESAKAKLGVALSHVESALSEAHRYEVQIADSTLRSPVHGRVLYRLAEEGEVLASGGKALTLINLGDVYMEIYLPSREAARVPIGADARIVLDAAPKYAARAKVDFVSPETQFTPKQVETASERDKLMFRIKLRIPMELILKHIEKVKTGVRGVGYIRLDPSIEWPAQLDQRFPEIAQDLGTGDVAKTTEDSATNPDSKTTPDPATKSDSTTKPSDSAKEATDKADSAPSKSDRPQPKPEAKSEAKAATGAEKTSKPGAAAAETRP